MRSVQVTFSAREDGQVDAHLEGELRLFNHALADSISSLPPRGAQGNGPSTYWIDHAAEGVRRAAMNGDERPFTSGNITVLQVSGGDTVVAKHEYDEDDEPGDALPLVDFLALLAAWRHQVIEAATASTSPLPETYRRNPSS